MLTHCLLSTTMVGVYWVWTVPGKQRRTNLVVGSWSCARPSITTSSTWDILLYPVYPILLLHAKLEFCTSMLRCSWHKSCSAYQKHKDHANVPEKPRISLSPRSVARSDDLRDPHHLTHSLFTSSTGQSPNRESYSVCMKQTKSMQLCTCYYTRKPKLISLLLNLLNVQRQHQRQTHFPPLKL